MAKGGLHSKSTRKAAEKKMSVAMNKNKKHPDEKEDKALVKKMIKKDCMK